MIFPYDKKIVYFERSQIDDIKKLPMPKKGIQNQGLRTRAKNNSKFQEKGKERTQNEKKKKKSECLKSARKFKIPEKCQKN